MAHKEVKKARVQQSNLKIQTNLDLNFSTGTNGHLSGGLQNYPVPNLWLSTPAQESTPGEMRYLPFYAEVMPWAHPLFTTIVSPGMMNYSMSQIGTFRRRFALFVVY